MSRAATLLVTVDATLEARSPLHIGAASPGVGIDLVVARDGRGRVVLPGTSLAGVLLTWARDHLDLDAADLRRLFGGQDERDSASRIVVDDAPAIDDLAVELRDHVGLDRRTGTAATGVKYEREVVPAGSRFRFHLEAEAPSGDTGSHLDGNDLVQAVVAHLVTALTGGEIRVGAASTRGLGAVSATDVEVRAFDLRRPDGMLALLDHRAGRPSPPLQDDHLARCRDGLGRLDRRSHSIEIAWQARTPVIVHDAEPGEAIDHFPLTTAVRTDGGTVLRLVLPGSSVKGVLRSHAERIVRTVLGRSTPPAASPEDWLDQLDLPLVDRLFGVARPADAPSQPREDGGDRGATGSVPPAGAGLLIVEDCVADGPDLDPVRWAALRAHPKPDKEGSGPLQDTLGALGVGDWVIAHHVGIDRWTGGAAENLLFTSLEPRGVDWPPMRLRLLPMRDAGTGDAADDQRAEPDDEHLAALGLLALVLVDLHAGLLAFGHGVNRGGGAVEVTGLTIDATGVDLAASPLVDAVLEAMGVSPTEVRAAWTAWIERHEGAEDGR